MKTETITAQVINFKHGPSRARQFGGTYDASTKLWTIRKTGLAAKFWDVITGEDAVFQYGFRAITCEL